MNRTVKKLAGYLPTQSQQLLKRLYFGHQIRAGRFVSDEPEYRLAVDWISPGDCVLDIGANIGHYTALFSQAVGPNGRVFAFEPMPESFELLAANVARMAHRNVTLVNAAASSTSGERGMIAPQFESGLTNYYMAQIVDDNAEHSVFTCPIDSLSIPNRVSLIKIDVEGHEYDALLGMTSLIERNSPRLIVEGTSDRVETLLTEFGYRFEHIDGSPNRHYYA